MNTNKNTIKRNIITTSFMCLGLLFTGASMASPSNHSTYQDGSHRHPFILPAVTVNATSELASNKVDIVLDSIDTQQQKKQVLNIKNIELNGTPYSILITKDGVQKNADMFHKMEAGDTLVTLVDNKGEDVKVRIMMKSDHLQRTMFSDLKEDSSTINVFPTGDMKEVFVLSVNKADVSNVAKTNSIKKEKSKNKA